MLLLEMKDLLLDTCCSFAVVVNQKFIKANSSRLTVLRSPSNKNLPIQSAASNSSSRFPEFG
jgi:hypothetical protein